MLCGRPHWGAYGGEKKVGSIIFIFFILLNSIFAESNIEKFWALMDEKMRKKRILLFIFLILVSLSFAESFNFIAEGNVSVFFEDEELNVFVDKKTLIPKGKEISFNPENNRIRLSNINNKNITIAFITNYDFYTGWISIKNLKIKDCEQMLPDSIISVAEIGISAKFVPYYFLEALNNKDCSVIKKYDYHYKLENQNSAIQIENEEYLALGMQENWFYPVISNIGIRFHNDNSFLFNKIEKIAENEYQCTGYGVPSFPRGEINESFWDSYFSYTQIDSQKYENLILQIDGDYINIRSKNQNKDLMTYVRISTSVEEQMINLFNHNTCDLSKLIWPRHADGSCDYDGSKTKAAAQTANLTGSTNVEKNKTMLVTENLKLRSGEATSTQVLTVMSAGTNVKILELGKAETIDGISSNWVKIEVQAGAKDREGKPIKSGTVGWCYGGYLE